MQKFQIQLVIGPYTVNHITEGESKEEVYNWVKEEFLFHKHSESQLWELEDVMMDPSAISLVRVLPYFEKVEEPIVEVENV